MIIIILALALGVTLYGYLRADERADRAQDLADRRQAEARRILRDARATAAAARYYRDRLEKYEISEEAQLASLPRDVKPIADVDEFLDDLFGGR